MSDHQLSAQDYTSLLHVAMVGSDKELVDLISEIYHLPIPIKNRLIFMLSRLDKYKELKESLKGS